MELLERRPELDRLERAHASASSGDGRLVLVRGGAGLGKTSLIRAFLEGVDEAHVLFGACDDLLSERPYGPVWDMSFDEPVLAAALEEGGRNAVYGAFMELLARRLRPTIIVIEDCHWADAATIDLIRFLGRRIERTHGLLVLTYRDEEVDTDHPLRYVMGDLPPTGIERLALQPLSEAALIELVGQDRGPELHSETGGNPFYVSEMLELDEDGVPPSIVDAVLARLARLGDGAREMVEAMSVVPGRIDRKLLEELAGHRDLDLWIDEAERRSMVVTSVLGLQFRHELARRAIEGSLTAVRRQELHRRVLDHLVTSGGDGARIVHHAHEAGEVDALLAHGPGAAEAATSVGSHREAHALYRLIRPHHDRIPPPERARLLRRWSEAANIVDDMTDAYRRSNEALALFRELGDPLGLGDALRWSSRLQWLRGRRAEARAAALEAVDVLEPLGPSRPLAFAYSTRAQLAMLDHDRHGAIDMADRAIAVAEEVGAEDVAFHALVNRGSAMVMHAWPNEADDLKRTLGLAGGHPEEAARGHVNIAWAAMWGLDLEPAERHARESLEICIDNELPSFEQYAHATLAAVLLMRGDWFGAEDVMTNVLGSAGIWGTTQMVRLTTLGLIHTRRGDPSGPTELDQAWKLATSSGELQRLAPAAAALGEAVWLAGGDADADPVVDEMWDRIEEREVWTLAGQLWMWRRDEAGMRLADRFPVPYRRLAEGDWAGASEAFDRRGMPYEAAVALLDGDEEARMCALRTFDDLGAVPLAARLRSELRAAGVTGVPRGPTESTRTNPAGLTARQAEVFELLREGLSNPEIADRLFISPRTVDHHVSAVLAKFGVTSRHELKAPGGT